MNRRKITVISIAAVIVIIVGVGLALAWNHFHDYSTTLNANWGFSLPSEAHYSQVYSEDSGASFHGDGIRYHIFSYKEEKPVNEMFDWSDKEERTIFNASYQDAIVEWLNSINVPSEKFPNYAECLYWYESQDDNSEMIVLWDASLKRIYIVESFL